MHPELEAYAHLKSPIHRWDPALKLVGFFLFILAVANVRSMPGAAVALVISTSTALIAGFPLSVLVRRSKWLMIFLLPLFVLLPIGIDLKSGFSWSIEGLEQALLITIRTFAVFLIIFPMWGTAPFHRSMKGLHQLGTPEMLVHLVLFTYRYIFEFLNQLRRMRTALRARGFVPGLDKRSFGIYGSQVGMLLVTSFEQSERILSAMKARGFDGRFRTLETLQRRPSDWVKLALCLGCGTLLFVGDRLWRP